MAISALLQSIYENVNLSIDGKLSLVCEIYEPDTLPTADGFDPADALACFSGTDVSDWAGYRGQTYHKLVTKWGDITRSGGTQFNSVSLTFSNDADSGYFIKALMLAQPLQTFEGYHLVIRIISRDQSVNLDDSDVRFVGRIDSPGDISRDDFPLSAKEHIGTIDVQIPRRKFSYDDPEGRDPADPEFEGFRFLPTTGSLTYQTRERRTDILGLFGLKKTVTKTLQYSSHSALDAGRAVPIVFGRCQMLGIHIGFADVGNSIPMLTAWADGVRNGIWKYENTRKVSPGFTELVTLGAAPTYRYGQKGGTGTQFPVPAGSAADQIGNGYYSYTAWTYTFVNGSEVDQDDPAPDLASIIFGCKIPTPDTSGDFTVIAFTDNPAYITRFILTDPFLMNIDPSFIDDEVCIETANWCDQYINDYSQADTVQLPDTLEASAGVDFSLYQSSGVITPDYFLYQLSEDVNPWLQEANYQFYSMMAPDVPPWEPPDPTPIPDPDNPQFSMRRRYTLNVPVTETQKCIDFLNNVVFAATGLYLTQGANGKIQIRVKKPVDFALVRQSTLAGVTEIPVDSVLPWVNSLDGKILIGANEVTGEVRKVTGWRYTTAGNSITLAVSGPVTASGATLSGGNNTTTPASATLTFTGSGNPTVTIDGIELAHNAFGLDTSSTLAGWFAAAINAHPTLGRYIKATWDTSASTIVTLTAKIGFLQFTAALVNAHTAAEEVLRIAASFSTAANADLTRSNMLDNSFKWSIGGQKAGYNIIELSFRDASQDWRYTTLRVKDEDHIAQVKKETVKEVNGTGIDNYNQAVRRANQLLAEERDSALEAQHGSDGAALLVEEGSVICVDTPDFPNLPIWVSGFTLKGDLSVHFTGKRYLNSIFSDTAEQRTVPIPTLLTYLDNPPPPATNLELLERGAAGSDGTWHPKIRGTFDFGAYAGPQQARVQVKDPDDTDYHDTNNLIRPGEATEDSPYGQGLFEIPVSLGDYDVRVVTENRFGNKAAALDDTITIEGKKTKPGDVPDNTFWVDPAPDAHTFSWSASADDGFGEYEVYENLSGGTPVVGTNYITGGTPSNLLYRGMARTFKVPKADPNFEASSAYIRFVDWSKNISQHWLTAGWLTYSTITTNPVIDLDAETTTPFDVAVHVTPASGIDKYNVAQTIIQIRESGGSWPSNTAGTDRNRIYDGFETDVCIGWLLGGDVEVRLLYDTPSGGWSNTISHTMAPVAGGSGVDATAYKGESSPTATEFSYLSGVTSAIQTQLDAKLVKASNLSDLASAATARTNLGLAIGTNVQAYDATLQSLSALGTTNDRVAYTTGVDTWAETPLTSFGRSLVDDADASAARTTLGLVIGTNVQAFNVGLSAIAGLTSAADKLPYFTGSGTASLATFTAAGRALIDDADASAQRTTLGLGSGDSPTFTGLSLTGEVSSHLSPSLPDTYDLGKTTKPWRKGYLSELDAVMLSQNTVSLIGGWLRLAKNEGVLPADVTAVATTINFGQSMTPNDFVEFRAFGQVEYIQVGTLVSGTTYNVTRNLDGSGANAWPAGSVYSVNGNTGNGRIELNSNSTPRISMLTQGATYNTQTEVLRAGDLNDNWGYSAETYGFAAGDYTKSWITVDSTNGLRIGNSTNVLISLTAAGNASFTGSITANSGALAGWTINPTYINSGTTYIASGLNIQTGQQAWFGKGSSGYQGLWLQDSGGRFIDIRVGNGSINPYIAVRDPNFYRVVIGGLNTAWNTGDTAAGFGMKVWDGSNNKLVEFSDTQNIIAGWTVSAASISSTGITMASGASAYLSFGTTPPTSATLGTGLFLNKTGLYGLLSDVQQAILSASTGKITAGTGKVILDSAGISVLSASGKVTVNSYKIYNFDGSELLSSLYCTAGDGRTVLEAENATSGSILKLKAHTRVEVDGGAGLAIGATSFGASAASVLAIANGTEPTTSPADMVQIYSVDLSAGNATLGLRTETAVVTEAVTSDRTLSIRINGTVYKVLLKS